MGWLLTALQGAGSAIGGAIGGAASSGMLADAAISAGSSANKIPGGQASTSPATANPLNPQGMVQPQGGGRLTLEAMTPASASGTPFQSTQEVMTAEAEKKMSDLFAQQAQEIDAIRKEKTTLGNIALMKAGLYDLDKEVAAEYQARHSVEGKADKGKAPKADVAPKGTPQQTTDTGTEKKSGFSSELLDALESRLMDQIMAPVDPQSFRQEVPRGFGFFGPGS